VNHIGHGIEDVVEDRTAHCGTPVPDAMSDEGRCAVIAHRLLHRGRIEIVQAGAVEITIVRGDIVTQAVDAVVNAANSGLLGGGGVDGAILRAGGPAQLAGRKALAARIGSLPTGEAAASEAGDMAATWIIHVVGPVYSRRENRRHLLVACYRNALAVAGEIGARSVAFPAVSAGIYGWPLADAADVAVHTLTATPTAVTDARLVAFNDEIATQFERAYGEQAR